MHTANQFTKVKENYIFGSGYFCIFCFSPNRIGKKKKKKKYKGDKAFFQLAIMCVMTICTEAFIYLKILTTTFTQLELCHQKG